MGIRRLEFIAIAFVALSALPGCEQIRRTKECRWMSELVNPTLRSIDADRMKGDDAAAYARIATAYETLAGKLLAHRYTQKRLGDAVIEYVKVMADAARDARAYSEALAAKDYARTALTRASAGRTVKKESAALLRIDGACTVR
jgi:hypothetical protein